MVVLWNTIKEFYNSKEWQQFRLRLIFERSLKSNGKILCENCGKELRGSGEAEVDHIKELTLENINDYSVSLNPKNMKVLCHRCHDIKHERFGTKNQEMFI